MGFVLPDPFFSVWVGTVVVIALWLWSLVLASRSVAPHLPFAVHAVRVTAWVMMDVLVASHTASEADEPNLVLVAFAVAIGVQLVAAIATVTALRGGHHG